MAYYVLSNGMHKTIVKGMPAAQKTLKALNKEFKDQTMWFGITDIYKRKKDIPAYLQPHMKRKGE